LNQKQRGPYAALFFFNLVILQKSIQKPKIGKIIRKADKGVLVVTTSVVPFILFQLQSLDEPALFSGYWRRTDPQGSLLEQCLFSQSSSPEMASFPAGNSVHFPRNQSRPCSS
jgi:hypothetical protein